MFQTQFTQDRTYLLSKFKCALHQCISCVQSKPSYRGLHRVLFLDPRLSDHHHGRDQVQNSPIGLPSLRKRGFLKDLFVLGHRARLKLGEIRSFLETLPIVQLRSNLDTHYIFIFPTIKHYIELPLYIPYSNLDSPGLTQIGLPMWQAKALRELTCQLFECFSFPA